MLTIFPFPLWGDFRTYRWNFLWKDLQAGLFVALLSLPQAMAYSFVAELPPQVGIFSAIFGTILTSAFGASRFLICGPTSQSAILLQSGISEIISAHYGTLTGTDRDIIAINILVQIVLISGIFQILGGLVRLGRLMQFISHSVLIGYTIGVAVAIMMTQAFPFFGLASSAGYHPIFEEFWLFIQNFPSLHIRTTLLGVVCLTLFIVSNRYSKKGLIPIMILIFAALIVYFFNLSPGNSQGITDVPLGQKVEKITILKDLGPINVDNPKLILPSLDIRIIGMILPLSLAIALLGVLQATAIGRSYTRSNEPLYNDNQELYGLGVSNILISFVGAMPSAGSFARSSINHSAGAKTRLAAIFSGIILLLTVIFLGPLVARIPLTALSAMMFLNAYSLMNFKDLFVCMRATRSDAFILIITFCACILFSFDMALYIGIAVSIVLYLKQAGVPLLIEYAFTSTGKLRPLDPEDERADSRIAIFQAEGELFFAAADLLQTKLRLASEDDAIKIVILQLLNARYIDASICIALKNIYGYLKGNHKILMISGVTKEVYEALEGSGIVSKVGPGNLFMANEQLPSEPTRNAYALAKSYLSNSPWGP